jgi:hypothetical protein
MSSTRMTAMFGGADVAGDAMSRQRVTNCRKRRTGIVG